MHAGEFGRAVAAAAGREDGAALAQLLNLHASATRRCCARIDDPASVASTLRVAAPWADILAPYLAAGAALFHADARRRAPAEAWRTAHEAMERAVAAFLRYFSNLAPGRWALPALLALLRDAQWVARGADEAATSAVNDRDEEIDKANELVEHSLQILGATALEDKLQEGVPEAIETLHQAGIKLWILTGTSTHIVGMLCWYSLFWVGDKVQTAIEIGKYPVPSHRVPE